MHLQVVIEPYSLQWPEALSSVSGSFRGKPGYIVDLEAPCEDMFLDGQSNKLRDMTKREVEAWERKFNRKVCAGKIENPMALAAIRTIGGGSEYKPLKVAETVKINSDAAELAAEADSLGIPDPDPDPGPSSAKWGAKK